MAPGMSNDDWEPSEWSKIKRAVKEDVEFFGLNDLNLWAIVVSFLIPIILLVCI